MTYAPIDVANTPYGLAGKTVLVTGASSGIGRAGGRALRRQRAHG